MPFIIAEISANHCGNIDLAYKLIFAAKKAGADAVKIQSYNADSITLDTDKFKAFGLWEGQSLYSLYKKASTPINWAKDLKNYADKIGIELFSTPFDKKAVDYLEKIGVKRYKIASFEAIDYDLIYYAAKFKKPMIISVGISDIQEIKEAINACKMADNNDISILKCTSSYPADIKDLNLNTIKDLQSKFPDVKIGLSDHSQSRIVPILATALGAKIIEKHFTISRELGGEDSDFSLNFEEFKQMVEDIKDSKKALGLVNYEVNANNRAYARSLYVSRDIKKGELITPENIRSIRPNGGLHPKFYKDVLNKKAKKDLQFASPLKMEDLI